MMTVKDIQGAIAHNPDLLTDECLYVELPDGEVRELCNITFKDGKVVLRPSIQL